MPTGDTRNVVPRTHENGTVGTLTKQWLKGFFKDFHITRWLTDGNVNVTVEELRNHVDDHPDFVTDFESAIGDGDIISYDNSSGKWINTSLPSGSIGLSTINGQLIPTFIDTGRGSKTLSVETTNVRWAEANVSNNDWIQFGHASDADSGFILPHNGTIVRVVGHCENTVGNSKNINLYIDGTNNGSIGQFVGAGEQNFVNNALNIDVNSGQKLRMRGAPASGTIRDTSIILWIRWRV